jgi:hypothetical protein
MFRFEDHDDLGRLRLMGGEAVEVRVAPVGDVDDCAGPSAVGSVVDRLDHVQSVDVEKERVVTK